MAPKHPSLPLLRPARKRAAGIIRVSEVAGREGESFRSPTDQQKTLATFCVAKNYVLVATFEELDVSGYSLQEIRQRKYGLAPAIKMIQDGEADVLLLPWLDRIARNLTLFKAARKAVEEAGGSIEAVDFGVVTGGTAAQNFSAEMLIHVAEFFAQLTAEKTHKAQAAAIAAGVPCFDRIPFGYRQDPDTRRLVPQPEEAEAVREAFRMRESGAPLDEIRDYLRTRGATYGIRGVQHLLQQRMYLGELRFGKLVNLQAHEPIIDPGLFKAVQGKRVKRGPRGLGTQQLLARMAIVRCAYCDHPLVIGRRTHISARTGERLTYFNYQCSSMQDCTERIAISAIVLEEAVVRYVKQADAEGHATVDEQLDVAERVYRQADQALSRAVDMFDGLGDLKATQNKLAQLRANRDEAFQDWQTLRSLRGTAGVRASDWDDLNFNERRALIRSTIKRVVVSRGTRGTHLSSRVDIKPFA